MNRNKKVSDLPGARRMLAAIGIVICVLAGIVWIFPQYFPYDRLNHLYGIGIEEIIPVGRPGGKFDVYCDMIPGSPEMELYIDGEYYAVVEYVDLGHYQVELGEELFAQPGKIRVMLRERFALPISLRSNTITLYVM